MRPPARALPPVTTALLIANVVIFFVPALLDNFGVQIFGERVSEVLFIFGAKINTAIAAGEIWRLFTATFLHASVIHIGFNGFALYSLGADIERAYGTRRFAAVYLAGGLMGSLVSYLLQPNPSVGASGAIFGLMGALGVFFYRGRAVFGGASQQVLASMIMTALINLGIGFSTPFIDNWGHIGGLIGGTLAALALAPNFVAPRYGESERPVASWPTLGWPLVAGLIAITLVGGWLLPGAK